MESERERERGREGGGVWVLSRGRRPSSLGNKGSISKSSRSDPRPRCKNTDKQAGKQVGRRIQIRQESRDAFEERQRD